MSLISVFRKIQTIITNKSKYCMLLLLIEHQSDAFKWKLNVVALTRFRNLIRPIMHRLAPLALCAILLNCRDPSALVCREFLSTHERKKNKTRHVYYLVFDLRYFYMTFNKFNESFLVVVAFLAALGHIWRYLI